MPAANQPPKFASNLLHCFVPATLRDVLMGDLEEEYQQRAQQDLQQANHWYWKQTMTTSTHYVTRYLASEDLLRKLTILVAIVLLPALIVMVSWLSNMDHASDEVWQNLLLGKVHSFLFTSEVLVNGTDTFMTSADLGMYINMPSILWALFTFLVLFLRNRHTEFSAHQAAGWGMTMMFLPYLFGLIYIDIINPEPKQIGPTVAFMTISIIYIILPLAWFIVRKSKKS